MTGIYKKYSLEELREFLGCTEATPVNMILDKTAVDFLLSLNINNRRLNEKVVAALLRSYQNIGWKSTESFCVTLDHRLGNGQHRSTMLKRAGYPENIRATVVFGADPESILVIDQHSKRSASASVKITTGKSFSNTVMSAIRHDLLCNPQSMVLAAHGIHPSEIVDRIEEWETYALEMPLLFHAKVVGEKNVRLTAPMILAIVHYRRRAGLVKANDFLLGFWGDRDRPADSPERKAMDFRVTMTEKGRGSQASGRIYRIFAWFLIAHYEGRQNPRRQEADDWGRLKNMQTP